MARATDTVPFNAAVHSETVRRMRERREEVHDAGKKVIRETGHLDPLVDLINRETDSKTYRISRNAFVRKNGKYVLNNGYAQPIVVGSDFTSSMGSNIGKTLAAMNKVDGLLGYLRKEFGFNTQLACAGAQDVGDVSYSPVAQMGRFESDNRFIEQIRLLVPANAGGDPTEDYQILMAYIMLATQLDITRFYGLKGYFMFMGDEECRTKVSASEMRQHTRHDLQNGMPTKDVVEALLADWHFFYLQVSLGHGYRDETTNWWERHGMKNRIVVVPDANLLAETQAALIYVCEHEKVEPEQVIKFLIDGSKGNDPISRHNAELVWDSIAEANIEVGAQAKLRAKLGAPMPKPGDIFAHMRHQFPIGHPFYGKNIIPDDDITEDGSKSEPTKMIAPKSTSGLDWSKL